MHASISFRLLPDTIAPKTLKAFRRDAGWNVDGQDAGRPAQPGGLVRWAVVQTGSRTIGIARLELAPPQFCYVSDLILLKPHRGRGLGGWFMQQIERHCMDMGIPRVLLQPTGGSAGFYEKLSFSADPHVAGFLKKELGPQRRRTPAC
ncbi:GNAT family N-acetyltransferase [uncultured Massilia sp.]|uniref:GNAT family N-acetyltransferase n=1 Tax=uncultured Massilia sp. TaxID=169973 RepID=UPI0025EC3654|nr:GNAT family N-acetyltransferase [uncultured Massilia sp.]